MNHIVKNEEKSNPFSIYRGAVLSIVIMFLIPFLFQFGHNISTNLTKAVVSVSASEENVNTTISSALIQSMANDDEMTKKDKAYLVKNWKKVDINDTSGGFVGIGDAYKYSLNFFMLLVLSILTIFLFFFIAVQMAKRVMEIALFKIIGPFCSTSLTNNRSQTFETWAKHTMGLFLITAVQFVGIGLLLNMFGSSMDGRSLLTSIFLIIGALLFVISTPTLISSLLGQQSGMMSGLGDLQSLTALGHGISAGIGIAGSVSSGALSMGTNVIKGGMGQAMNFGNQIFSHNNLGSNQMASIKDEMSRGNHWKANQLNQRYVDEKMGKKPSSDFNSNSMSNYSNIKYNPLKNNYMQNINDRLNNKE